MPETFTKDVIIAIEANTWYSLKLLAENMNLYTLIYN